MHCGRCAAVIALLALNLTACGGSGGLLTPKSPTAVTPVTIPGSSAAGPAPTSVQFATIATPDTPAGGIAVVNGVVFLDAASHFLSYNGSSFTSYGYVAQEGQAVSAIGGVNSLANAPGSDVSTIVQEGGAPPFRYSTALDTTNGHVIDSGVLTVFADDGLVSVARASNTILWVMGYQLASGTQFLNNGTVTFQNGLLANTGSFGTNDVFNAVTLGADGFIYAANDPFYNSQIPPAIYKIDPTSGTILHTFALSALSNVQQLAPGADGAVWFTDSGTNNIGRIAQDGTLSSYLVPTANSGVSGITAGSDNAMWFTETTANKIGRIGANNAFTEYTIPTANTQPSGIAAGAPGACIPGTLFFVEANGLGKVTFAP